MKYLALLVLVLVLDLDVMCQDEAGILKSVEQRLSAGSSGVSELLGDQALMPFHSSIAFREIIRKNAKPGKINIVSTTEPGTRIKVTVLITDAAGKPENNALVYVYHTSDKGWYSDTAAHIQMNEGDRRHARLFGYARTEVNGRFDLETIKPRGYPQSSLPAHIHIEIETGNGKALVTELLFDDDPRLVGESRTRSLNEGFIIAKNTGTLKQPVYSYAIKMH